MPSPVIWLEACEKGSPPPYTAKLEVAYITENERSGQLKGSDLVGDPPGNQAYRVTSMLSQRPSIIPREAREDSYNRSRKEILDLEWGFEVCSMFYVQGPPIRSSMNHQNTL